MAIKLTPSRPDDRYIRMYYRFVEKTEGDARWFEVEVIPEDEAGEEVGWIEFWADDAKACKEPLKRLAGRIYVLQERREKRKGELSDDKAYAELEEYNSLIDDGLAHRTKAWRLVDSEGNEIEAQLTFENAKSIYGDESHDLRQKVQDFLKDRRNFPLRVKSN